MKKIICLILSLVLLCSLAFAQGSPNQNIPVNNDIDLPEEVETQNYGQQARERARSVQEIKDLVMEKKQQMNQEIENISQRNQNIFRNQNEVRATVHSLLAMEDLVGGIGQQVKEVSMEFNNSVEKSLKAEEKIVNRSGFRKFFFGGDHKTATELNQSVNQNQERVQELRNLLEECDDCGEEVKQYMQENIQQLNQEQERLQELVNREKRSKGIFGWLWK